MYHRYSVLLRFILLFFLSFIIYAQAESTNFITPPSILYDQIIDFGTVNVNDADTMSLYIKSLDPFPLILSQIIVIGTDSIDYTWVNNFTLPDTIYPNDSVRIDIRFSPDRARTFNATFHASMRDQFGNSESNFTLYGKGANEYLALHSLSFDTIAINNSKILPLVTTNTGVTPVAIAHFQLFGIYSGDYTVLGNPLTTITPGATDSIPIQFHPTINGTEYIVAELVSDNGDTSYVNIYGAGSNASSVSRGVLPDILSLSQNYPNPFSGKSQIVYSIPQQANVTLSVFDQLGRKISTLVSGEKNAGNHTVLFNSAGIPTGVYYYELRAGTNVSRRMMQVIR